MNSNSDHRWQFIFVVLILLLSLPACDGDADITSRAWIDSPLPNQTYALGESIPITCHFFSRDGMETYRIEVDGETLKDSSITQIEDNFMEVNRDWIPDEIGDHVIVVVVLDAEENVVNKAEVTVRIIDQSFAPDLVVTDVRVSPDGEVICDYGNLGPGDVAEDDEVQIAVYVGTSEEILNDLTGKTLSDDEDFVAGLTGTYTTVPLSWIVEWPQYVSCFIDYKNFIGETDETNNEIIRLLGPDQTVVPLMGITPTATETLETTETPQATSTFTPTMTLTLSPTSTRTPSPTNTYRVDDVPPTISNMVASDDPIFESPCQPDSVRISVEVVDSSGLQDVKLYYRIAYESQVGKWIVLNMQAVDDQNYQITLGPSEFSASMSNYVGKILQFYVKAWDNVGNVAETTSGNVHIQSCVQ